jgi:UDP-glucuronate decarboxylase
MKALVTGAAGFIGSHLVDRLLDEGHEVVGLDNLYTGSMENLAAARNNLRFRFEAGDVRDPIRHPADVIFNFASPASPKHYQADAHATFTTNVLGALRIAEVAAFRTVGVIQASTSEIYGDPDRHPQVESYWGNVNPIGPRACYDEGKRAAETVLVDAWRRRPFPLQVLRIFNTFGPRMTLDDGRVVSNFVLAALRGEEVTIHGSGAQTRSFCYVDDLVDGIIAASKLETFDGPINLGNPTELTIVELAGMVSKAVGVPLRVRNVPLPEDDPRRRRPDISRARERLGFSPQVGVEDGIRRTVEDFARRLGSGWRPRESTRPSR